MLSTTEGTRRRVGPQRRFLVLLAAARRTPTPLAAEFFGGLATRQSIVEITGRAPTF
jgi:hypothetical protein